MSYPFTRILLHTCITTVHVYNDIFSFLVTFLSFTCVCSLNYPQSSFIYLSFVIIAKYDLSNRRYIQYNGKTIRQIKSLNKVLFTYAFLLLKHIKHIREYFVQCCQLFIPFQMLCYWYITVYQMSNTFYFSIRCLLFHVAIVLLLSIFQCILDQILCLNSD